MLYSVKCTPTRISDPLRRVDTGKRFAASFALETSILGHEAPPAIQSDKDLPCRLLPTSRLLVSCTHPPKGRASERNHIPRIISSAEFH